MTTHDYKAAAERYRKMREAGKLAHLTQAVYENNLQSIGLFWHGPPAEDDDPQETERELARQAQSDRDTAWLLP